jgi:cyanate permease
MTQLGGGEAMVGIMNMLGAVVEIPGMFWADSLSKKYSPVQLLMAAFVIHALAFLGVILFPSVESILVAQALNGLVLSLTVVSEIRFIQLNTEESRTAETIALITITLPAIVSIIFSPISGAIFDARGASVFYLIGLIGHLLAVVMLKATLNGSTKRKSVSAATGDGDQED